MFVILTLSLQLLWDCSYLLQASQTYDTIKVCKEALQFTKPQWLQYFYWWNRISNTEISRHRFSTIPSTLRNHLNIHFFHRNIRYHFQHYSIQFLYRLQVNFGDVFIPPGLDPPRPRVLPEFKRLAHGLRSGNISVLDAKTFYIPNLHYDGAGPDAYFWVGNGSEPNPFGTKVWYCLRTSF